jgi:hypothetical protein
MAILQTQVLGACGPRDWPTKDHLDLLCERAAGLFVYAVATIKFIDSPTRSPMVQLDYILQSPESSVYERKARTQR